MRLLAPRGVFSPRSDSRLLAGLVAGSAKPGMSLLDPFCGSGIVALAGAIAGADATAVDISRRAVWTTRLNARLNGVRVRGIRASDLGPLGDERFDLIAANPPYLPGSIESARGEARAWEAGPDGRTFIDRLCHAAPARLAPGGRLLLIHSSLCGEPRTVELLHEGGLDADVIARQPGPLGPLMASKFPDERSEEILVFEARSRTVSRRPRWVAVT